ncbi:hypothetical protein HY385_02490 [Candidatus Daviesbacteria bacterium]|nr:hypothetical protein [Candidatus Daviesbacteria bacterium]
MTSKQFLYILIATFITIIIWVTVDIIHSRAKVQPAPEVRELLEPISPNFDQEIINKL